MSDDNERLVREAFEQVWAHGDFTSIAEDYVDHNPAPGVPGNREGLMRLREMTLAGFPDFAVTVEDAVAAGDKVAVRLTNTGTHEGTFLGIPPTGAQANWTVMAIFRVADDSVVERWGLVDAVSLLTQLGAFPRS
ncbi:MAG: ester cyclase [Actinobacteria bacterium]|nr:ester cyclase [Actinomycetota bacterium]